MARLRTLSQISFFCSISLAIFLLFSLLTSSPLQEPFVVHEAIEQIPHSFIYHGPVNSNHVLNLTISMTPRNMSGLELELKAISDPKHSKYGNHLTKEQVDNFVQPDPQALDKVVRWLKTNGLIGISSSSGNNIKISIPASQANALLNSTFNLYNDTASGRQVARTEHYSLPASLSGSVLSLYPTVQFWNLNSRSVKSSSAGLSSQMLNPRDSPGDCSSSLTPQCVTAAHDVPASLLQESNSGVRMGILNNGANMDPRSTAVFLKTYLPDLSLNGVNLEVVSIGEDQPLQLADGIVLQQLMLGIAPRISMDVYAASGDIFNEIDSLSELDDDKLPSVITMDFSFAEVRSSSQPPQTQLLCDKYMQLASRGVTVLAPIASGNDDCESAQYPASCPYVTAVGSTDETGQTALSTTPGSFSLSIPMPSYQQEAVEKFINQNPSIRNSYNTSGRGTPDLSMIGQNILVSPGVEPLAVSGSGISVGVLAAIIAAINAQRLNEGKPQLGFINTLLYSNADKIFNDVTAGEMTCGEISVPATKGWDIASGLGSLNVASLLEVLSSV